MVGQREQVWAGAFALAVAATLLSILVLDRPAASFAHAAFHGAALFVALTHIIDPVPPLATLGALGLGAAVLFGWSPPPVARMLLAMCIATLLAIALKDQLKYAFGRTWPETWVNNNPSWIRDGIATFTPFHGGPGWASFPSGHMTVTTAPMATLAMALRTRWRWLCALPVLLMAVGLYGADYHFVGDIIAGTITGAVSAAIVATLLLAPPRMVR